MSEALVPTVQTLPASPDVATAVVFVPRGRDWKYLDALREILARDGNATTRKLATELAISHQAVSKLQRRPGFAVWVGQQLRTGREDRFEQLYERNWHLAMKGSIDHSNWCAKVEGRFQQPDAGAAGIGPIVNVHIRV